jgi:excinuclease ABC subunit B
MYADRVTESMRTCIEETNRRREIQLRYNEEHGITPQTIEKSIQEIEFSTRVADVREAPAVKVAEAQATYADEVDREEFIKILEEEMRQAAEGLDFERAALLRDQLFEVRAQGDDVGGRGRARRRPLAEELRMAAEEGR